MRCRSIPWSSGCRGRRATRASRDLPATPGPRATPDRRAIPDRRATRERPIVRRLRPRAVQPRDGRAVALDVLRHLHGEGRAPPALVLVEGSRCEARHLVRVQQLSLPRELPVPRALPRVVVDPELEPPVEVVLVLRDALEDPESPPRDAGGDGRPRDAWPALH